MLRLASCHAAIDPQGGERVDAGSDFILQPSQNQQPVKSDHHRVNFLNPRRTNPQDTDFSSQAEAGPEQVSQDNG